MKAARPVFLASAALAMTAMFAAAQVPLVPPLSQPTCEDAPAGSLFATWSTQLENLAFDGRGHLYVTDLGGARLLRFGPDGAPPEVLETAGVHGVTLGPDCRIYLGAAPSPASGGAGPWQVWRFAHEIDMSDPSYAIYAEGLPQSNGMAFDDDGNLYVSNPLPIGVPPPLAERPTYLVRIPAGDPSAWEEGWSGYGPNGLWNDGTGALLAAITGDQSSTIVRIPFADPEAATKVADLSFGLATLEPGVHEPSDPLLPVLFKGLDDLTLGPDGRIYAAAHVTGEILRVDPEDGSACVFANGLYEPTSVRFAHGFGEHDGALFVTDMGGVAVTALVGPGEGSIHVYPVAADGPVPGAIDCTTDPAP